MAGWNVRTYIPDQPSGEGEPPKFKMEYTDDDKRAGKMSAVLRPLGKKLPKEAFTDARFCGDAPFPGSATRISAFIKGDRGGSVRFSVLEFGTSGSSNNYSAEVRRRGGPWTKYEVVTVPTPRPATGSSQMCLSLGVTEANRAWIDDVTFTKLDLPTLPPQKVQPLRLENLDMEVSRRGALQNWSLNAGSGAQPKQGFALGADTRTKRSGRASLRLTAGVPVQQPPGDSADNCFDPNPVRGKTLRIAGWIKADVADPGPAVFGIAAIPFTVAEIATITPEEILKRGDSYHTDVFILSAADWSRFEVIGFVPESTRTLCIGIRLDQLGSVWADDLTAEVIDL